VRNARRVIVSAAAAAATASGPRWEWEHAPGFWLPYDAAVQRELETVWARAEAG